MTEAKNLISDYKSFYRQYIPKLKGSHGEVMVACCFHNDGNPSMSINLDTGLWHCFSGCGGGDAISFLSKIDNITPADVIKQLKEQTPTKHQNLSIIKPVAVAEWDYHDENNNPVYRKIRFEPGLKGQPKSFTFKNPSGSFTRGHDPVLYNLPAVISSDIIVVVEGERKADKLIRWGYTGTTADNGAIGIDKNIDFYVPYLKNKKLIIIIPDNDGPSKKTKSNPDGLPAGTLYANTIISALQPYQTPIKVIHLPNLPTGGDIIDWKGTKEDLEILIKQSDIIDMPELPLQSYNMTDTGNAERFVAQHKGTVLYCYEWKKWVIWDGKVWQTDNAGLIFEKQKQTVTAMREDANKILDDKQRISLLKNIDKCENEGKISAMLNLARPGLAISAIEFDKNEYLLNCDNGTIDLRIGKIKKHDPLDLITKLIPTKYSPGASSKIWENFICDIMTDNSDMFLFLQRASGYSLTGSTKERIFFILHGKGSTGKSTFIKTLAAVIGTYSKFTPPSTLMEKNKGDTATNDLAALQNVRLVLTSETDENQKLSEAQVKNITGNEPISARFLFGEFFSFQPKFHVWLATNHKPRVSPGDDAIWNRIKLIPFKAKFDKLDLDLDVKLLNEKEGILAWMIEGARLWYENGLGIPAEVNEAVKDYRSEMDILGAFFQSSCILKEDERIGSSELYAHYKEWAGANGERFPLSQRAFSLRITERADSMNITKAKDALGRSIWKGITKKEDFIIE